MTTDLYALAEATVTRAQQQNHAHVRRLIGLLDLEPPLRLEAIHKAIDEELADQRACAAAALSKLEHRTGCGPSISAEFRAARGATTTDTEVSGGGATKRCDGNRRKDDGSNLFGALGAEAALEALEHSKGFPADELRALHETMSPEAKEAVDAALDRFDRFERRLGWLLRPSTFEEVQKLDPRRDANQIYHFISYEFRLEQKLFAVIFELAAVMLPYSALMFTSTGEFTTRAFKRINDTVMFFANMIEWGLESKRGRDAVARVNGIHGRYSLPSELFRFILSGIMFLPVTWNERVGWRRFTDVERLGWFHTFAEMGRAMNIHGVTHDYDEMRAWWDEMLPKMSETSPVGAALFQKIVIQVLATYPAEMRKVLLGTIVSGLPDEYRECLDVPPPTPEWMARVRHGLRLIGVASSQLPRVPWIRSFQLHPLYKDIGQIGVKDRSAFMPSPPEPTNQENNGYPTWQKPVPSPSKVPHVELPVVSMAEVAKHTRDDDAWIAIDGYVYDVTRFLYEHPGGRDVLAKHFGQDGSGAFERVGHSRGALTMMANFRIARLEGVAPATFPDPEKAGGRIQTGRRVGRNKVYGPDDFERTLDFVVEQTALYEQAKRAGDYDKTAFPIKLPSDPRPLP